jgi:hypothetical protein
MSADKLPSNMNHYKLVADWNQAFQMALEIAITRSANRPAVDRFIFLGGDPQAPPSDVDSQVAYVMAHWSPRAAFDLWRVSLEWAAAVGVSGLDEVIGKQRDWGVGLLRQTEYWLLKRASETQLGRLAQIVGVAEAGIAGQIDAILSVKSPQDVLAAWQQLQTEVVARAVHQFNFSEVPYNSVIVDVDARVLRQWALRRGVPVEQRGRVPTEVRVQYLTDLQR